MKKLRTMVTLYKRAYAEALWTWRYMYNFPLMRACLLAHRDAVADVKYITGHTSRRPVNRCKRLQEFL